MKRQVLFVVLVVSSALVLLLDIFYVVFAATQFSLLNSGNQFLSQDFKVLSICAAAANILLAIYAAVYLLLRLALKKGV